MASIQRSATMTATDSSYVVLMANICPSHDGAVVYNARALYSHIYGDLKMWPDMGCDTADAIADRRSPTKAKVLASSSQQYSLSPNPNSGNFILTQASPDDGVADVEIWNAVGGLVQKMPVTFKGGHAVGMLQNPTPGVYTMRITTANGSLSIIKFTVL